MVDGKPQLINPSAGATIAYDPRTGNEICAREERRNERLGSAAVGARPDLRHHRRRRLAALRRAARWEGDITKSARRLEADQGHPHALLAAHDR